jgi:predicted dehydrogenase
MEILEDGLRLPERALSVSALLRQLANVPVVLKDPLQSELRAFVNAAALGASSPIPGEDGLAAVRIALAMRSCRSGGLDPHATTFAPAGATQL